jgi:hypothetical protein
VFGLINGLAKHGRLSPEEERFKEENHAWFHANLVDPSDVDPHVYDRYLEPLVRRGLRPALARRRHCLQRASGSSWAGAAEGANVIEQRRLWEGLAAGLGVAACRRALRARLSVVDRVTMAQIREVVLTVPDDVTQF